VKPVIDSLPAEVPYGVDSDDVAIFAGSPRAYIQQADEAWENLDPLLNQVIGYGATPETLSQRIRRGKFGMDGMYTWLKVCVEELNISEGLLEGKIERLIDAMLLVPGLVRTPRVYSIYPSRIHLDPDHRGAEVQSKDSSGLLSCVSSFPPPRCAVVQWGPNQANVGSLWRIRGLQEGVFQVNIFFHWKPPSS